MRVGLKIVALLFAVIQAVPADARCPDDFSRLVPGGFSFRGKLIEFERDMTVQFPKKWPNKKFTVRYERISSFDPKLRRHFRALRTATRAGTSDEREMGELIGLYSDGTSRAVRFTSNQYGEISPEAVDKALKGSGLITEDLVGIIDIHTHPNRNRASDIEFSPEDIEGYRYFKAGIQRALGRRIDYSAVMLPNCTDCENVALTMEP